MNYIKQLQQDKQELNEIVSKINEDVVDLFRYLHSEKFYIDNSVNKDDIILRLNNVLSLSYESR